MEKKKREALSIPNLITYVRMLLIPCFVLAYMEGRYLWALACLALSGLSDIADGFIARHFNMITDLGKVLDPIADKLTQAAMIFSVAWHVPAMWVLLGLLVVKELAMLFWGWYALRRTGEVNSAKWYGKVCTFVLYASMAAFVVFPNIPAKFANIIAVVCGLVMLMSLALYSRWYILLLRQHEKRQKGQGLGGGFIRSHGPLVAAALLILAVLLGAVLLFVFRG